MSDARESLEARRAALVARAATEREVLANQLGMLGSLDEGLEGLGMTKPELPTFAVSAGLGLSALLLALPAGHAQVVRGGIALIRLAASVKRLLSRP